MNLKYFGGATQLEREKSLENVRVQALQAVGSTDAIVKVYKSNWHVPFVKDEDENIIVNDNGPFDIPLTKGQTVYGIFEHFEVTAGTVVAYHI